ELSCFTPRNERRAAMSGDASFHDFMARVRAGDDAAAAELVRRYEPYIKREVKVRLVNARLRRGLDSMDVCQSALASFFVRAALGQFDLDQPAQLIRLLTTMVRNKLADQAKRERRQKRDCRRVEEGSADERDLPGAEPTPSRQVAAKELLEEVRKRLTHEE